MSVSPSRWALNLRRKVGRSSGWTRSNHSRGLGPTSYLGVAEHLLPAGREVDGIGTEIPVEDTVVGALDRQGVAFFAVAEGVIGGLACNGVTDGTDQQAGVDLSFDEVVLRSFADGMGGQFVVVETGQDDHRHPRCRLVVREKGVETKAVGQRENRAAPRRSGPV